MAQYEELVFPSTAKDAPLPEETIARIKKKHKLKPGLVIFCIIFNIIGFLIDFVLVNFAVLDLSDTILDTLLPSIYGDGTMEAVEFDQMFARQYTFWLSLVVVFPIGFAMGCTWFYLFGARLRIKRDIDKRKVEMARCSARRVPIKKHSWW